MIVLLITSLILLVVGTVVFSLTGNNNENYNSNKRLIQIGLNKSGTTSIYQECLSGKWGNAVHWNGGKLAKKIMENYKNGQKLLKDIPYAYITDVEDPYNCFFPFENEKILKLVKKQYPNAKFLLNIRSDEKKWIKSRMNHANGRYPNIWIKCHNKYGSIENSMIKHRNKHHEMVKRVFKDEPNRLLVFSIENDDPNIFRRFAGIPETTKSLSKKNVNHKLHK